LRPQRFLLGTGGFDERVRETLQLPCLPAEEARQLA